MSKTITDLWASGYTVEVWTSGVFRVWRPDRDGSYLVDTRRYNCECRGFWGAWHCKHMDNLKQLLLDQCLHYAAIRKDVPLSEREQKDHEAFEMLSFLALTKR